MFRILVLSLGCCVALCTAVLPHQSYHLDFEDNADSVTLKSKHPNLLAVAPNLILSARMVCSRGFWVSYNWRNYYGFHGFGGTNETSCYTYGGTVDTTGSTRYLGPDDESMESISFYNETWFQGTELTVIATGHAYLPEPLSLFTTGTSLWTLFTGENFDGTATCIEPSGPYSVLPTLDAALQATRSVLKGCNARIDHYFRLPQDQLQHFPLIGKPIQQLKKQ